MTNTDPAPTTGLATIADRARAAVGRQRVGGEEFLFTIRDEVAELLTGSPFEVDPYLQAAYREVVKSKDLVQAARDSGPTLLGAIMLGATLQLPIGGPLGQFYLTPRSEKRGDGWAQMVVPMIGYRGFFELGYRSGRVSFFDYLIVREGDEFKRRSQSERGNWYEWEQFENGEFDEDDAEGNKRTLTGVVALARLSNGDVQHRYMSRTAIERRRPKNWAKSPWNGKDADAMYVKTPHREMAKYMQLSIASARAVEADEHIAEWNKVTEAIDTVHDDDVDGRTYDPNMIDIEPSDGIGADAGDVDASRAPGASSPASPSEGSKPADGRTASLPHPSELPTIAEAERRDMTEDEYERYSIWRAEQETRR